MGGRLAGGNDAIALIGKHWIAKERGTLSKELEGANVLPAPLDPCTTIACISASNLYVGPKYCA